MANATKTNSLFQRLPALGGLFVALAALVILLGWHFRVDSMRAPFPVGHPITPWGALLFLLLGVSVALGGGRHSNPRLRVLATVAASFVLLHSGLTIGQYASGLDFGIDSLFMGSRVEEWWVSPGPRGRYALNAALAFAGLAVAILVRNVRRYGARASELLALLVGALALTGLVGYVYGVHALSGLGQKVWMARNGAVLFGALAVGTFFLDCNRGLARLITARHAAGVMTRRLLFTSMSSIFVLGWMAILAIRSSVISVEVATATLVVSSILVTCVLIFSTASTLHSLEQARQADSLALQESAERLKVATEAAGMGIWIWNTETNQLFASEKAKELFGIGAPAAWLDYEIVLNNIHPDDRDRIHRSGVRTFSGSDYANEYRVVHADRTVRWLASRGRRLPSLSGKGKVFGVIWDETDHKLAEEALIRNEKLATVGRMAASIAHEVNNPLAAAMNLLFLSVTDASLSGDVRQYIIDAQAELNRIAHITRQTLGFYRERSSPGNVAVEELAVQLCEVYKGRAAQNGVTISLRIRRPVAPVFGNAGEIRQVLSNLFVNAVDAMPGGGKLHIRLTNFGPNVRLTVADSGTGIAPSSLGEIFEAFFTTKEATGTGLGLWISRQIIERHKGTIRVRSKVGRGTVFTISLPATAEKRPTGLEHSAAQA